VHVPHWDPINVSSVPDNGEWAVVSERHGSGAYQLAALLNRSPGTLFEFGVRDRIHLVARRRRPLRRGEVAKPSATNQLLGLNGPCALGPWASVAGER